MVSHLYPRSPTRQQWYERIEHYTPNETFGRSFLAILSGSLGLTMLIQSVTVIAVSGLLWLPLALVFAGAGLVASILAVIVFWPVYLSLIGNIESVKTYSEGNATSVSEEDRDDSIGVVKQQYAAGNISEAEFERRVENLLHADAEFGLQSGTMSHRDDRDGIRETD